MWFGMWFLVGGIGVSVGFHRHFSHRSFSAHPSLRYLMAVAGSMAAQGSPVYWVALHRMHHTYSDISGDPHSPHAEANGKKDKLSAFIQGHMGWALQHDVPMPSRYARDLQADAVVQRVSKYYALWVLAGLALPALIAVLWLSKDIGLEASAILGLYWGGILRLALGHHIIWSINSVCHLFGSKSHATPDKSTNVWWLSLISWGESWHNNHHHAPTSARFGVGYRQPDIGWWFISLLCKLRVARVRLISR